MKILNECHSIPYTHTIDLNKTNKVKTNKTKFCTNMYIMYHVNVYAMCIVSITHMICLSFLFIYVHTLNKCIYVSCIYRMNKLRSTKLHGMGALIALKPSKIK